MADSALSVLEEMSREMGFAPQRRELDGDYACPTHDTTLRTVQLGTFAGWFEVTSCPSYDGSCGYDPNGPATHIDIPPAVVELQKQADASR